MRWLTGKIIVSTLVLMLGGASQICACVNHSPRVKATPAGHDCCRNTADRSPNPAKAPAPCSHCREMQKIVRAMPDRPTTVPSDFTLLTILPSPDFLRPIAPPAADRVIMSKDIPIDLPLRDLFHSACLLLV